MILVPDAPVLTYSKVYLVLRTDSALLRATANAPLFEVKESINMHP